VFKSNSQLGGGFTEGEMHKAAYHNRLPTTQMASNTLPLMKYEDSLRNKDDKRFNV